MHIKQRVSDALRAKNRLASFEGETVRVVIENDLEYQVMLTGWLVKDSDGTISIVPIDEPSICDCYLA